MLVALGVSLSAQTAGVSSAIRARVDSVAAEITPTLIATRRDIHQHPELGFRETRTAALVADRLRALKFDEVRTGIGVTGVIGILKGGKPGKVVAIRADMDALPIQEAITPAYKSLVPNVNHSCGHDGHTSILLGVADVLSRMRAEIPGTVMIEAGAFANPKPDAIFGLHLDPQIPVGQISVHSGPAMASASRFTLKVTPVTFNEPALATASISALKTVFGDKIISPQLQMVSEDFSYFQQQMPGFYFFVGIKNEAKGITAMWHTEFYDMDEAALAIGVRALSNVALEFLFRVT